MSDSDAVYCTLTAEEQRTRRSQIRASIVDQVVSVTSIVDGLLIDFGSTAGFRGVVEEFIELEKGCCAFLTFTLSPPDAALSLQVQGPSSAAPVIEVFRRTLHGENQ